MFCFTVSIASLAWKKNLRGWRSAKTIIKGVTKYEWGLGMRHKQFCYYKCMHTHINIRMRIYMFDVARVKNASLMTYSNIHLNIAVKYIYISM